MSISRKENSINMDQTLAVFIVPTLYHDEDFIKKSKYAEKQNIDIKTLKIDTRLSLTELLSQISKFISHCLSTSKVSKKINLFAFGNATKVASIYTMLNHLEIDSLILIAPLFKGELLSQSEFETFNLGNVQISSRIILLTGHDDTLFETDNSFKFVKLLEPIVTVDLHIIKGDNLESSWGTSLDTYTNILEGNK